MSDILTSSKPLMTIEEIFKYLPHRYPFLLIDKVISIGKDTIEAQKNVTVNEPYFNGHFPGNPIFPGVLMIEAMAQACGIYGFYSSGEQSGKRIIFLVGVDKVRFRRQIIPGDTMQIHGRLLSKKRSFWSFEARIEVDKQIACEAQILCTYTTIQENE